MRHRHLARGGRHGDLARLDPEVTAQRVAVARDRPEALPSGWARGREADRFPLVQMPALLPVAFDRRGRRDYLHGRVAERQADLLEEGFVVAVQRAEAFVEQV